LLSAADISADGQTIVGTGINPAGFHEGWVATIPEPTMGFFACLAIVPLVVRMMRARRRYGR
jgi:hypothetical protein